MENEYRNALLKGTLLEGYEIIRVLGCGTFGMTYLAKDTQLNMQVAIKEYLPSDLVVRQGSTILPKSTDSDMDFAYGLERFEQEAQTLVHCKHPNVVQVLRYLKANGTGYMVMNYEEGAPLDKILERNMQDGVRLTEEELTENILFPLLGALKQVHAAKFLHRDIKPGNIYMRRSDEMPILLDFGAARFALGEKSRNLSVVLTDGYAPFEQYYEDGNQGPWTDIYALAAVAYYIVSGNKPPVSAARKSHDKMVPATEAGKGLFSHQLLEAIDHALAVNEEDRPESCEEWLDELQKGAHSREGVGLANEHGSKHESEEVSKSKGVGDVDPNCLPVGYVLHQEYSITEVVDRTAMGIIYLAKDFNLDQEVMIEEYFPDELVVRKGGAIFPKDQSDMVDLTRGIERFIEMSKKFSMLNDTNIMQLSSYFFSSSNNTAYRIMRCDRGVALTHIISDNLQETQLIEYILLPFLKALSNVHALGLLHRCIAPGQIHVRHSDQQAVLNLSVSDILDKESIGEDVATCIPRYAPFEQYYSDGNQGAWTDIYALGAVAYRIVTGNPPPDSVSRIKKDKMIPAVDAARGRYSEKFLRAIDHALVMDEQKRPQSCEDWAYELLDAQGRAHLISKPNKETSHRKESNNHSSTQTTTQNFTIVDEKKSDPLNDVVDDDISRELRDSEIEDLKRLQEAQRKEKKVEQQYENLNPKKVKKGGSKMNYFIGPLKKYADFKGRASRKEYWMFVLFYSILSVGCVVLDTLLGMMIFSPIFALGLLIPSLSVGVRRLHDTGRSAWWLLINLIPLIGGIVLLVFLVQDSHEDNDYGTNPKSNMPV